MIDRHETEFLVFQLVDSSVSGKTQIYSVANKLSNWKLGYVKWATNFRKYAFTPNEFSSIFDAKCLRDIADFCERITNEHKEKEG